MNRAAIGTRCVQRRLIHKPIRVIIVVLLVFVRLAFANAGFAPKSSVEKAYAIYETCGLNETEFDGFFFDVHRGDVIAS